MRKFIVTIFLLLSAASVAAQDIPNTPKIPLPFILTEGAHMYMSFWDKPEDKGKAITGHWEKYFNLTQFQEGSSLQQMQSNKFKPGSGFAVFDQQWKGALMIVCHSGLHAGASLQCEGFRKALEGGLWDNVVSDPDDAKTTAIFAKIMANANNMLGDTVKIAEGNNPSIRFQITAVSYLPHGKAVDDYSNNDKVVFDIAQQHDITGTSSAWQEAIDSPQQFLILAFCGWGPFTAETDQDDSWASWSRYVLLLKPVDLISSDNTDGGDGTAVSSVHTFLSPNSLTISDRLVLVTFNTLEEIQATPNAPVNKLEAHKAKKILAIVLAVLVSLGLIIAALVNYKPTNSQTNQTSSSTSVSTISSQTSTADLTVEPTFSQTTVLDNLDHPWDIITFTDDSFIFTERNNKITYYKDGQTTALTAPSDTYVSGEGGMLGLAIDPKFAENSYIYACFSTQTESVYDLHVARFKFNLASPALTDRTDIVTGLPATDSGRHSGCQLEFGPDDNLWIGTGDAATGINPQNPTILGGKILRVDRDGNAVAGNLSDPFDNRIFSYGHRNTQGLGFFSIDAGYPIPGVSIEQGSDENDEVNQLITGNFGWDPVPDYDESVPMTDTSKFPDAVSAIWSSGDHTDATSGGTIIHGSQWKAWDQAVAVAVLKNQRVMILELNKDLTIKKQSTILQDELGRIRTVQEGHDGNLYVLTDNGDNDKIIRLTPQ